MWARLNGMIDYGGKHRHIQDSLMMLVEQVKGSEHNPLLTCLLEGPRGRYLFDANSYGDSAK